MNLLFLVDNSPSSIVVTDGARSAGDLLRFRVMNFSSNHRRRRHVIFHFSFFASSAFEKPFFEK